VLWEVSDVVDELALRIFGVLITKQQHNDYISYLENLNIQSRDLSSNLNQNNPTSGLF
jgi:hypothetical protein